MSGKRLTREQREAIIADIKARIKSFHQNARDHSVSQSTVSAIAKEEGISPTRKRRRSPAAKDVRNSFTREQRVNLTDRILGVIGSMVEEGGLNPRELKETTAALKQTLDARRAEDFPEPEESAHGKAGNEQSYESLVSLYEDGTPRNIAALFALRDIEIARDAGDAEGEENAKDRLRQACVEAGLSDADVPIDAMIAAADKEHDEKYGSSEAQAEDAEAEYQGEGRS